MGNQKRRPLAPAAAVTPAVQPHQNNITNSVGSLESKAAVQQQIPSFSYQLYTLRPNRNSDPQSIIEAFNKRVYADSTTVPIVLDLAAYHRDGSPHYSPPAEGTLVKLVNSIRSHVSERSKKNICIVGVTNLPPPERKGQISKMMIEAQTLNLPVIQRSANTQQMPSNHNLSQEASSMSSGQTQSLPRKKRGGVAPLLRPRRPGVSVATTDKTENDSIEHAPDERTTEALHLQSEDSFPATKVHKGSIRSGQLVTSDLPNQSLVILGSINPGGEVWSEGDVFVFGKLRGRVLAGLGNVGEIDAVSSERDVADRPVRLSKDTTELAQECTQDSPSQNNKSRQGSRIFATSFDPELICISGEL